MPTMSATDQEIVNAATQTIGSTEDCCRGMERHRLEELLATRDRDKGNWNTLVARLMKQARCDPGMIESFNTEIIFT